MDDEPMPLLGSDVFGTASSISGFDQQQNRPGPSADVADTGPQPGQFDIFEWHPAYQSCQKYFLDHAQYETSVLAVTALLNICLPHQWSSNPVDGSSVQPAQVQNPAEPSSALPNQSSSPQPARSGSGQVKWVSLVPFVRRLVVTGFDKDPVMHGFFGDDWRKGVGPVQECERRNYLFAAKSGGWTRVKDQYDMGPHETVPFLQPPQNVQAIEIENAEKLWSQWLAMEDWMVGPRAPERMEDYSRGGTTSPQHQ